MNITIILKNTLLLLILTLSINKMSAQLSGTYNVPGDFADLASAVSALNTQGVGATSVIINLTAGNPQAAPAGGYRLGSTLLNASTSISKTITFNGNGNTLTANTGTSTALDGIFTISGTDNVMINGFTLVENAANTTQAAAMEWGIAMINLNSTAPFDGCQNNTIQNCNITLNRTIATVTRGIYAAHITLTVSTALIITATSDAHSNNKVYGNTISNVATGIQFAGYSDATPFALYSQNNDFGGSSLSTGNNITNFGGTIYSSVGGIIATNQNNANASYNTIDQLANGGVNTVATSFGIYLFGTNSTLNAHHNNIKLSTTPISAAYTQYGIYANAANTIVSATNNTVNLTVSGVNSMACYGVYLANSIAPTISNNNLSQSQNTSGACYGLYTSGLGNAVISTNTIKQTSTAATVGQFYSIVSAGNGISETITNNSFDNTNISMPGYSGFVMLIYTSNTTGNKIISENQILGSFTVNSTNPTYLIYNGSITASLAGTATITNNNFTNVVKSGTGQFYGIAYTPTLTSPQNYEISGNTISNVTCTDASQMMGIGFGGGSTHNINNNIVEKITSNGTVFGIYNLGANNSANIFKNKISKLSTLGTGTGVFALTVGAGASNNVHNNVIGELTAPSANSTSESIRGISLISTQASSSINVSYNTVNINAVSTGAEFSTSALFHTSGAAGIADLTMRNNILVNNSTPNGGGLTAAYRRSSTVLDNFVTSSNNNLYYAGTPSANHLIMYDGTNSRQTLGDYQTAVAPRENLSISENPNFKSTDGASVDFLRISTATATAIESGGVAIAGINTDIDNDIRQGSPGYPGNGSAPDIGADEFNLCSTVNITDDVDNQIICLGQNAIFSITATNGNYIQWQVDNGSGFLNISDGGVYSGTTTNTLTLTNPPATLNSYVYRALIRSNPPCSAVSSAFGLLTIHQAPVLVASANPNPACPGSTVTLSVTAGNSYQWSGPNGFTSTLQNPVLNNVTLTDAGVYSVTVTNDCGTGNSSVNLVVATGVSASANASPNPICVGATLSLTSSGGTTYAWSGPNGFTSSLQNPTIPGITIAGGGLYTVTVTSVSCGTATASVNVTVNPLPTPTIGATPNPVCSGSTLNLSSSGGATYAWSGPAGFTSTLQNPTRTNMIAGYAGSYVVTVTSSLGCSASASISVSVNAQPVATATATPNPICAGGTINLASTGGTSYSWAGPAGFTSTLQNPMRANATVAFSGTYTVTVTNGSGCSATASVNVVVNPVQNATASATPNPVCFGEQVSFSSSGGSTYQWSGPAGFSSTLQNPTRFITSMMMAGTYTVTVSTNAGCISTANVNLAVNPLPVGTISISPSPACVGSSVQLSATGGSLYSWTGPMGWTSTQQNPTIQLTSYLQGGEYKVTITTSAGCMTTLTAKLNVYYPPVAAATYDLSTACVGSNLKLAGKGAGSFAWTGPNGWTSNLKDPVINGVTATNSGMYILAVTSPNGCVGKDTLNIVISNPPALSANPLLTEVCVGATVNLSATGNGSFEWSGPATWQSQDQNPVINNIPIHLSGYYNVTLTAGSGCKSTASVEVKVYDHSSAKATASPDVVCEGQSLQLHAEGGSSYLWVGPAGFSAFESDPRIDNVTKENAGIYSVYAYNEGGCFSYAEVTVTVKPSLKGIAYATPNPVFENNSVKFYSSDGIAHSWTGPNGFTSNEQHPTLKRVTRENAGIYVVTITNENGCPTILKVNLKVTFTNKANNGSFQDSDEIEQRSEIAGQVYPNPTNNFLYFNIKSGSRIEYLIYDVSGKIQTAQKITSDNYISTEHLNSGVYQIRWKSEESDVWNTNKFVKIK